MRGAGQLRRCGGRHVARRPAYTLAAAARAVNAQFDSRIGHAVTVQAEMIARCGVGRGGRQPSGARIVRQRNSCALSGWRRQSRAPV